MCVMPLTPCTEGGADDFAEVDSFCAASCAACPESAESAAAISAKGGCASTCSAADLETYCTACAEGGADDFAECTASGEGACFSGASTVSVLKESGGGTETMALKDLPPNRRVLAATADGKKTFAEVDAVMHNAAVEDYLLIAMQNKLGDQVSRRGGRKIGQASGVLLHLLLCCSGCFCSFNSFCCCCCCCCCCSTALD